MAVSVLVSRTKRREKEERRREGKGSAKGPGGVRATYGRGNGSTMLMPPTRGLRRGTQSVSTTVPVAGASVREDLEESGLRSIPGDGRRGGERCAAPQGACGLVGPTGGGGGRSKGTALVEGHSDRQKGKRGKERSGWGSAKHMPLGRREGSDGGGLSTEWKGPRHLAGRRWSVEASHHRPIIRGNVQEKPDARAVGILGAGVRGRSSAYRSLDGGRAHRRPDSI
jgi:hypothetical protein